MMIIILIITIIKTHSEKNSYIFSKKAFVIFWENVTLIFREMEPSNPKF